MEVRDILKQWLSANGYDGLYGYECGCELDDIAPCGEGSVLSCEPGYRVEGCACGEGHDFHIRPVKEDLPVEKD